MPETSEPTASTATDEVWRLFAAVELPLAVRERLADVIRQLRGAGWHAKWVNPEATHLTLKFYGNVPLAGIPALGDALRTAVVSAGPIRVAAHGAGAFPNVRRPRVLWVGVEGDVAALQRLQGAIERASAKLGFPPEDRAFSPHLTVARIRPEDLGSLTRVPERLGEVGALPELPIPVAEVTLFRSRLGRTGATYSVVDQFPLDGDAT